MPPVFRNKPVRIKVGIDFGTTHTIVSVPDKGNYPVLTLAFDYNGETLTAKRVPSTITWFKDSFYFGPAAVACYLEHDQDGAQFMPSIKRLLPNWYEGKSVLLGRLEVQIDDLLTQFLTQIRKAIADALDCRNAIFEAVVTIPANASSSQRYVTLECFRRAGFKVFQILYEPCAAAIQFVHERYKRWQQVTTSVVIYDLGGGTFDCTLLSIDKGRFDPVYTRGIGQMGGDDFDAALVRLVAETAGAPISGPEKTRLMHGVRLVKEAMSAHTKKLHIDTANGVVSLPVPLFLDAVKPMIDRTVALVENVVDARSERLAAPSRIVLVGGATLLALIPRILRQRFGRAKIHRVLYPFASVAIGAAIHSDHHKVTVRSRLNHHFVVLRVREDGSEYADVIFKKGQPLPKPGNHVDIDRPIYDPRHNIGRFQYLECDALDPVRAQAVGDIIAWNEIRFPFDSRLMRAGAEEGANITAAKIEATDDLHHERILEEYRLDEYGIITVRISRSVQDSYAACYALFRLSDGSPVQQSTAINSP